MRDDLFFVPVLSEAMRNPDDIEAVYQAILNINEKCRDARYHIASQQWRRFLEAVRRSIQTGGDPAIPQVAFRMLLSRILSESEAPPLKQASSPAALYASAERPDAIALQVHREDELVVTFPLPLRQIGRAHV